MELINADLLARQINLLCGTGISHEAVQKFVQEENLFYGSTDTLIAENYLKKIASWKNYYNCQGEKITLYGVINWYFNMTSSKLYVSAQDFVDIPFFLLKLWLVNWHMEPEDIQFKSTKDWNFINRLEAYELAALKFNQCLRLSADDFIKDLKECYRISLNRFEDYKTSRGNNPRVIKKLTPQYSRFLEYLSYCREHLRDADVIRINKLEPGYDDFSWYFIIDAEGVSTVLLSDFA